MYLYFDRYGTLKEQITFNPARVGNSNVNKIFVYWEGVEEFPDWAQELALQTRYLLQDNTQYPSATTFGFSAQPETTELPFDKNQDLKYFKYYKEYKFLTIDIPDEVLSYNGAVKSYIWVLNADKKRILGLGVFAFMVDGNIGEVKQDETITIAQWNMIAAQLGLLSGSVIDVTCDIETNTLKVYYANGLTAVRNLPPNGAQTTISSDFLREMIFSTDAWVQDGEQGYYLALSSSQVGFTDNKFFIQLEEKGEYNSKQGGFVLSDNIFKGNDGSVLLYSAKPFDGRLLLVGGDLLSGDSLVTGLSYNGITGQLTYKTADGVTHSIYLDIPSKLDKSSVVQTTGDSTVKVMSQKAATDNFARLVDGKVPESQLPSYVDDVVEYDSKSAFPAIGEEGKIYVDKSTNLTYRWSGSTYIQVGGGDLALENGTGDVLIQTTDSNQSFKVMTDGRAKVQSAPTESDDVVRKQDLDKPYELIEEITLTEDTAKIDRAGYNLKDVCIYINAPQYTDTHGITFIVNGGNAISCRDVINKDFNAMSALYASIKGDLLFMGYTQNTNSGSNALNYQQGIPFVNIPRINGLTFQQDVGKVMPAGIVIKIYGR